MTRVRDIDTVTFRPCEQAEFVVVAVMESHPYNRATSTRTPRHPRKPRSGDNTIRGPCSQQLHRNCTRRRSYALRSRRSPGNSHQADSRRRADTLATAYPQSHRQRRRCGSRSTHQLVRSRQRRTLQRAFVEDRASRCSGQTLRFCDTTHRSLPARNTACLGRYAPQCRTAPALAAAEYAATAPERVIVAHRPCETLCNEATTVVRRVLSPH
jgi:hypothetical protein